MKDKKLGQDFKNFMREVREIPGVAEYLDKPYQLSEFAYTEEQKEALIDSMFSIIKGHLMKCDVKDITIDKTGVVSGFWRKDGTPLATSPTGEYTYKINFKYRKEFR
ncbi:hypothetical protein SAMN04487895_101608 [Paenibacillus sophorae]|uniref:Uncharacterized protein n=1 Tax=Paenibacillus sophorae TaxID=1333845 RepID=A0A1H8GQH3_9BACL|nr:hypothetical protein [Paenibacillus sophorae]QWU14306.1 hypothetical protein KP014_20580 [Paenibacillus sophorae]SEN46253.1 hypothetical protein SAMN04487895_101608 [Paenibacillus sophorae]